MISTQAPSSIRAAREAAGLSQDHLAELTGMSKTTVSNWERGVMNPRVRELPELRRHLKVSLDYLIGGEDARLPSRLQAAESQVPYNPTEAPSGGNQRWDQLLKVFAQLSDAQQRAIIDLARTMVTTPGTRVDFARVTGK